MPDHHLDPFRMALGSTLRGIVTQALQDTLTHRNATWGRLRAVRKDKKANLAAMVECLLCGLLHARLLDGNDARLILPIGKARKVTKSRYARKGFHVLKDAAESLQASGWVTLQAPEDRSKATTAMAGTVLIAKAAAASLNFQCFGRSPEQEIILLRHMKPKQYGGRESEQQKRGLIDYRESSRTTSLRQELAAINAALSSADLQFALAADSMGRPVDTSHRHLVRKLPASQR